MILTHERGIYIASGGYEERDAPKRAGFLWHGGNCRPGCAACAARLGKQWWTKRPEIAARLRDYADDSALAALAGHLASVGQSKATNAEIDVPCPMGLEYLGYQRAGIAFALSHENVLFGDEMGLGKTIEALGTINADSTIRNVLVICPASLRLNWIAEAQRWLVPDADRPSWEYHVVDSDTAVPDEANFIACHYNRLVIGRQKCPTCAGTKTVDSENFIGVKVQCRTCVGKGKVPGGTNTSLVRSLMSRRWDALIVDEAHYVKTPTAARTRAILGRATDGGLIPGLIHQAKRKMFLTGTPIPNRPVEIWPVLHALAPTTFNNYIAFIKRYCDAYQERVARGVVAWNATGASHLEELQERMRGTCMIRRLKADVLKDLPPKRRQIIRLVADSDTLRKAVESELAAFADRIGDDAEIAEMQIADAQATGNKAEYDQAVSKLRYTESVAFAEMSAARKRTAVAKIPSVLEHLDNLMESGLEKVVVYGHHHEVVHAIADHYEKASVLVYGETKMEDRQKAIERFQTDPIYKVFVGSIGAAGVGITLTAASHVVFAELDWVPGNVTQAEDRCHRIGQIESVTVEHLVVDGSLDSHMAQMIVDKQLVADRALDLDTRMEPRGADSAVLQASIPIPKIYPVATVEQRLLVRTGLQFLTGMCDNAHTDDARGFSKIDTAFGHRLAAFAGEYSDAQVSVGLKLCKRYRRQLPESIARPLGIYEEPPAKKVKPRVLGALELLRS